jgi:hypothetical protein
MDEMVVRKALAELLVGRSAHADFERAIAGVAAANRARRPAPEMTSIWEELEHIRIAQRDIVEFTLDPEWESPAWPDGYWPKVADGAAIDDATWDAAVAAVRADLGRTAKIADDPRVDLTARIPHGDGQTYLREILLVADHNAYHVGQIVAIRKVLGDWKT